MINSSKQEVKSGWFDDGTWIITFTYDHPPILEGICGSIDAAKAALSLVPLAADLDSKFPL
jgi:hypothetical protein